MHFHFQAIDAVVIIVFLIATIVVGLWYSRKAGTNKEEFFLAGRTLTWPLIGASLFATNISTQQFVGQGGLAYSIGIGACFFQLLGAVATMLLGLVFAPRFLRMRLYTLPQFMEERFSPGIRAFLSGFSIVTMAIAGLSGVLYSGAIIMQRVFNLESTFSLYISVVVLAVTAALYTLAGGLKSVVITDFIQNAVLLLGGLAILIFALIYASHMPDGLAGMWYLKEVAADGRIFSKWSLFRPYDHAIIPWFGLITGGLIVAINGHCTSQDYLQRCLGAKNIYHASMGSLFASLLKVVAVFLIGVPGVIAAYIFQGQNVVPDQAFTALIIKILPAGITGLVLAALIASIMSSVDSVLAACSSLYTVDFYLKKHKNIDEKKYVSVGRITMVVVMLIGILWIPVISSFSHLYVYFQQFISYIAPPIFTVYLFGLFYKRANHVGAMATLILGTAMGAFVFFLTSIKNMAVITFAEVAFMRNLLMGIHNFFPAWLTGMNFLYGCFYHFLFCVAAMLTFSHLTPPPPIEKQEAAKRNDKGGFDNETPYASRNVKIMTAAFIVALIAVFIAFS